MPNITTNHAITYTNTRVFIAAENGWLGVLELVAVFLLKTGTWDAKNS